PVAALAHRLLRGALTVAVLLLRAVLTILATGLEDVDRVGAEVGGRGRGRAGRAARVGAARGRAARGNATRGSCALHVDRDRAGETLQLTPREFQDHHRAAVLGLGLDLGRTPQGDRLRGAAGRRGG